MGFVNSMFKRRGDPPISGDTMVALTDDGKRIIDKMMVQGKAYPILSCLDEHSPRSISQLSKECQINLHMVKNQIKQLCRQGMVRVIDYGEE